MSRDGEESLLQLSTVMIAKFRSSSNKLIKIQILTPQREVQDFAVSAGHKKKFLLFLCVKTLVTYFYFLYLKLPIQVINLSTNRHRWTGRFEAHLWDKLSWNVTQKKKGKQGKVISSQIFTEFSSHTLFLQCLHICKGSVRLKLLCGFHISLIM